MALRLIGSKASSLSLRLLPSARVCATSGSRRPSASSPTTSSPSKRLRSPNLTPAGRGLCRLRCRSSRRWPHPLRRRVPRLRCCDITGRMEHEILAIDRCCAPCQTVRQVARPWLSTTSPPSGYTTSSRPEVPRCGLGFWLRPRGSAAWWGASWKAKVRDDRRPPCRGLPDGGPSDRLRGPVAGVRRDRRCR